MSWDVILVRTKNNNEEFKMIQDIDIIKFTRAELMDKMLQVSKEIGARVEDLETNYVHMRGKDWSIEISFLGNEPYKDITLEIRGKTEPKEALYRLKRYLNARLFDMSTGQFIDELTESGFEEWKSLCDNVVDYMK